MFSPNVGIEVKDINDPFSTDRFTRYIHFSSNNSLEKAALLSRYSRSQKSLTDLLDTEFKDKNRAPSFMSKLLSEFGDDSVAELASETIGIEGLSLLAASKLTDQRIGISFIEKSTRYVPFSSESFYIPAKMYEYGLVDEFKELCTLSHFTFTKIYEDLIFDYIERYPISSFRFKDSKQKDSREEKKKEDVLFSDLDSEDNRSNAIKAYNRSIKDKAFDIAGYCWLTSLKTNIGFNSNGRALEYLIARSKRSRLQELNDISENLYSLLKGSVEPFIIRTQKIPIGGNTEEEKSNNPFNIYPDPKQDPSLVSFYKHNIATWLRAENKARDTMDEIEMGEEGEYSKTSQGEYNEKRMIEEEEGEGEGFLIPQSHYPINRNMVTTIINKFLPSNIKLKEGNVNAIQTNTSLLFNPKTDIVQFFDEQSYIDTICSAILFENNENLLEYDQKNASNMDQSLRISTPDPLRVKEGILYDLINQHKTISEIYSIDKLDTFNENNLSFENIQSYWYSNREVNDTPIYQDYCNPDDFTLSKDQHLLLHKYTSNRKTRRDRLGRAFELVNYLYDITSSFRIMREFKRHRMISSIYPSVITARDSYDSFIFPLDILKNRELFESYKNLIKKSFDLYSKIINKHCKDYITAQYCLPISVKCNYISNINLRELDYILSLRTTPQAHPEFREIAIDMYDKLKIIHPNLAKIMRFVDTNKNYKLGRLKSEHYREQKKVNSF